MIEDRVRYWVDSFLEDNFFFLLRSRIVWKKEQNPEGANCW